MRRHTWLAVLIAGTFSVASAGCGDDDTGSSQQCGDEICEGTETPQNCPQDCELCGNAVLDDGEACDGTEFGGETCQSQGNDGGNLVCNANCSLNTNYCCADACDAAGDTQCTSEVVESCELNADGCLEWVEQVDCSDTGDVCVVRSGTAACEDQCIDECDAADDTQCSGTVVQTCTLDAIDGCLHWIDGTDCDDTGEICEDASGDAICADSCTNECTTEGDLQCNADAIEECQLNFADGCNDWIQIQDCTATSDLCNDTTGTPFCCSDGCTSVGETRCTGSATAIETCGAGTEGCNEWLVSETCDATEECQLSGVVPMCLVTGGVGEDCTLPATTTLGNHTVDANGHDCWTFLADAANTTNDHTFSCDSIVGGDVVIEYTTGPTDTALYFDAAITNYQSSGYIGLEILEADCLTGSSLHCTSSSGNDTATGGYPAQPNTTYYIWLTDGYTGHSLPDINACIWSDASCPDPIPGGPQVTSALTEQLQPGTTGTYTLTFNEDVTGVDMTSVTLTPVTGTGTIASITPVSASSYDVALVGIAGGDSYTLTVGTTIVDLCGNPMTAPVSITIEADPLLVGGTCSDAATVGSAYHSVDTNGHDCWSIPAGPLDTINNHTFTCDSAVGGDAVIEYTTGPTETALYFEATISNYESSGYIRAEVIEADCETGSSLHCTPTTSSATDMAALPVQPNTTYYLWLTDGFSGNYRPDIDACIWADNACIDLVAGPPQVTSPLVATVNATSAGTGLVQLEFDQGVTGVDLTSVTITAGTGAATLDAITPLSSSLYEVAFSGAADGEVYTVTLATTITDLCGDPMTAAVDIQVTIFVPPCFPGTGGMVGTTQTTVPSGLTTTAEYYVAADADPNGWVYVGGTSMLYRISKDGSVTENVYTLAGLGTTHVGYAMLVDGQNIYTVDSKTTGTTERVWRISSDGGATWVVEDYATFPSLPNDDFRSITAYDGRIYLATSEGTASNGTEIWSLDGNVATLPDTAVFEGNVANEAYCAGLGVDDFHYYLACSTGDKIIRVNRADAPNFTSTLVTDIPNFISTAGSLVAVDSDSDGLANFLYAHGYEDEIWYVCDPSDVLPYADVLMTVGSINYGLGFDPVANALWVYDDISPYNLVRID